jgi:hypothetical protein
MGKQSARRAGLDTQAGHWRERPERDRRIDGLAVEVLDAIGEREAAERSGGTAADDGRPRTAFAAAGGRPGLGDTVSVRSASRLLELARPDQSGCGSGDRPAG